MGGGRGDGMGKGHLETAGVRWCGAGDGVGDGAGEMAGWEMAWEMAWGGRWWGQGRK